MLTVKRIIFVTLMVTVTTVCQSQCKYLVNKADEFTGQYEQQLELSSIGRGVLGSVGRTDSLYYVCVAADVGCTSPGKSKLYVKFSDDVVLELTNVNKIHCNSMAIFIGYINDDIEAFKTKTVSKARLSGTERSVDFDFKDSHYFIKGLMCLK